MISKLFDKIGQVLFIVIICEYGFVFFTMIFWISIENFFKIKKFEPYVRTPGHWESLNFMIRWAYSCLGLRVEVEKSIENDLDASPVLFMSTHGSFLDVMTTLDYYKRGISFPTKDSLFKIPGLKWVLQVARCIPINRSSLENAKEALIQVRDSALREN